MKKFLNCISNFAFFEQLTRLKSNMYILSERSRVSQLEGQPSAVVIICVSSYWPRSDFQSFNGQVR